MLFLIAVLTFASVALLVTYVFQPSSGTVRGRILDGTPASDLARRRTVEGSANQRLLMPVMRRVGASLSRLLPANLVRHVEQLLVQAGEPMSLGAFLTIWLIVAGSLVLFSAWLSLVAAGLGTLPLILIVALMNLYGTFAPYAFLRGKAERRKNETEKALPDALDLLLTSSQAGLSVDAAFALVAQRTHGPLAEQFTEYLKRVGLGRSSRDALNDIAERSGATSLKRLASIVAQATEVGTSMGDVMRLQAAELREVRRLKAKEAASRAPILMTIPLALCFMLAMGAVIVAPSVLQLVEFMGEIGLR